MKYQIKNRYTGTVIYECDVPDDLPIGMHTRHALESAARSGADLGDADLRDADLRGADLRDADLGGADLRGADLRDADLRDAYLCYADLRDADLRDAYLCYADLGGADLRGADLRDADLGGEKTVVGKSPFFQVGPIGSRSDYLVAISTDAGTVIRAGCFTGSVDEFLAKLESEHGDNIHATEYRAAVALIETHFALWSAEETKGGEA